MGGTANEACSRYNPVIGRLNITNRGCSMTPRFAAVQECPVVDVG